mmetsp:Transcript_3667/g.6333  ORF Transcript_3667/g.6333 Transcript_3667/m.6333 type:complete len:204 (+) Transcript_3667:433-1044(+)
MFSHVESRLAWERLGRLCMNRFLYLYYHLYFCLDPSPCPYPYSCLSHSDSGFPPSDFGLPPIPWASEQGTGLQRKGLRKARTRSGWGGRERRVLDLPPSLHYWSFQIQIHIQVQVHIQIHIQIQIQVQIQISPSLDLVERRGARRNSGEWRSPTLCQYQAGTTICDRRHGLLRGCFGRCRIRGSCYYHPSYNHHYCYHNDYNC